MTNNKLGIVAQQEIPYDMFEGIYTTMKHLQSSN